MKKWADINHPSYHGKKTVSCLGCGERCSRSSWGPWCFTCNVYRMTGINRSMVEIARSIGEEMAARKLEND